MYFNDHPELGVVACAKNLGISKSAMTTWRQLYSQNNGEVSTKGRGDFENDDAKETARAQWIKPYTVTTTDSDFNIKLKNVIQQEFNPDKPNAIWCSDITYIWTYTGFVYLTSVIDLFSRKIIAWTLSTLSEANRL